MQRRRHLTLDSCYPLDERCHDALHLHGSDDEWRYRLGKLPLLDAPHLQGRRHPREVRARDLLVEGAERVLYLPDRLQHRGVREGTAERLKLFLVEARLVVVGCAGCGGHAADCSSHTEHP